MRVLTCQEFLKNYDRFIYESQSNVHENEPDEFSKKVDSAAIRAAELADKGIDAGANIAAKVSKAGIESMVTLAHFMKKTKRKNVKKALIILTIIGSAGYFGINSLISLGISEKEIKEAKREIHTVKSKETLYKIAKEHGTTVNTLKEINNIEDPNTIKVGQGIVLPEKD